MKHSLFVTRYNKFVAVPPSMGCSGYMPELDYYITYTKDNGEKVYILNSKVISKEEGNAYYKQVKERCSRDSECNYFEDKVVETPMTDAEFIKEYEGRIDRYTEYIDNYKQQKDAEDVNARIRAIINAVKEN